jgi:hypothetical protein
MEKHKEEDVMSEKWQIKRGRRKKRVIGKRRKEAEVRGKRDGKQRRKKKRGKGNDDNESNPRKEKK